MKNYYSYTMIALAITLAGSAIVSAQTSDSPAVDPKIRAANILREKVRADVRSDIQNRELTPAQLLEARNKLNAVNRAPSTTMMERKDIRNERREEVKDIRMDARGMIKNSSTTMMERKDVRKDMRADIFNARKNALVKQMQVSISNLVQISIRISSRIDKAVSENRNMTEAKALLVTANTKIESAKIAVQAVADYTPPTNTGATSTNSTNTSANTAELAKPRELADAANKAIKDAHDALVVVVNSVAHNMGLKTGQASSTNSTATQ